MIPSILETAHRHVDGWRKIASDADATFVADGWTIDDGHLIRVNKTGMDRYTVTFDPEIGDTNIVRNGLDHVSATAVVIGYMQQPALFEQHALEGVEP